MNTKCETNERRKCVASSKCRVIYSCTFKANTFLFSTATLALVNKSQKINYTQMLLISFRQCDIETDDTCIDTVLKQACCKQLLTIVDIHTAQTDEDT